MTIMYPGARWVHERAVDAVLPNWVLEPGDDIRVMAEMTDLGEFHIT